MSLFRQSETAGALLERITKAGILTTADSAAVAANVLWTEEGGFSDFKQDLQASLPVTGDYATPGAPYGWVEDVSLDCAKCLICWTSPGEDTEHYVAKVLTDAEGSPQVEPQDGWVAVQQQYVVAKADGEKLRPGSITSGPDKGGYPIKSEQDLKNAIEAIGRAKDPTSVKAHIKSKAKSLGLSDLIPDDWK